MALIDIIKDKSILVFGDLMLDVYVEGNVDRISPEAPVPILLKKGERQILGGAANVAANLRAAKQNVSVVSVIGNDSNGDLLIKLLESVGAECSLILRSKNRRTTTKTRLMGQDHQQIVRLDEEDTFLIDTDEEEHILMMLKERIERFDIIVISDYMKGVVTENVCQGIINLAKVAGKKVVVDVKDKNFSKYAGAYLLKPNQKELHILTGCKVETINETVAASQKLCADGNCEYVLTTCGGRGMVLTQKYNYRVIDSIAKTVFDVSGAGDTVISYLATCLANDIDVLSAVTIANDAAGIKVSKVGTAPVLIKELVDYYGKEKKADNSSKVVTKTEMTEILKSKKNQTIVFTNGCFDILHYGHVSYLSKAAEKGDILIVGLNNDESVRKLKGTTRPVNNEHDRSNILAALECVDYVVIFGEQTPESLIEIIRPDILVKGADYKPEQVVGREFVESYGGRLELIQFIENHSTTDIISKIKGENGE